MHRDSSLHAARVRAAEAEARHRVHERQTVERPHRPDRDNRRTNARKARERLTVAEARVSELEKQSTSSRRRSRIPHCTRRLTAASERPSWAGQLEEAKSQLDAAIAEWETASVEVDESVE